MNKVTSVVRNLHVCDLNKIAQIIEVASDREQRANFKFGGREVGICIYMQYTSPINQLFNLSLDNL